MSAFYLVKAEVTADIRKGRTGKAVDYGSQPFASLPEKPRYCGVRNFQARNSLKAMKKGDLVFFYHSHVPSGQEPGIAGIAVAAEDGFPDPEALDEDSPFHDPKHTKEEPRWYSVDLKPVRALEPYIPLSALKRAAEGGVLSKDGTAALTQMPLLRQPRLSVQALTMAQHDAILELEKCLKEGMGSGAAAAPVAGAVAGVAAPSAASIETPSSRKSNDKRAQGSKPASVKGEKPAAEAPSLSGHKRKRSEIPKKARR